MDDHEHWLLMGASELPGEESDKWYLVPDRGEGRELAKQASQALKRISALLPCPLCGAPADFFSWAEEDVIGPSFSKIGISCTKCALTYAPDEHDEKKVIKGWNKRAKLKPKT